jgi:hypothetical protein
MDFYRYAWFWAVLGGFLLFWAGSLVLAALWGRRRAVHSLAREPGAEGLEISLKHPRPEDRAALEIIWAHRRRVFLHPWPETQFGFTAISELSQTIIREIAQVYYPEEARPELKASLGDLVALHNRVGARLRTWLDTLPFRAVKDLELETVLRAHEIYQTVRDHPVHVFLKRHHLDQVARWAWSAANFTNPWYWASRATLTGGREALGRLFMAKVAAVVGEEALRLYGRRLPNHKSKGLYLIAVQEMINLGLVNGHFQPAAAGHILRFILEARGLEDQEKLALARRLARPRLTKPADPETLEKADRQKIGRWLLQMVQGGFAGEGQEIPLAQVQSRWGDR